MRYYPISLDVQARKCLVVGGGAVGTRKVKTLVKCGARVIVISPYLTKDLEDLSAQGTIDVEKRVYSSADLDGLFLVIGATGNDSINRKISADAERLNILCNIADVPDACNFILPSIVERGDLTIAISTSGKSPAFAKKLRQDIEKQFGEEYALFLELMGSIRKKLLMEKHEPEAHKHLFETLIRGGLLEMVTENKKESINILLKETLGKGFEYDELISH